MTRTRNIICPDCNEERTVTYSQWWNIFKKHKSSGCCQRCVTPINGLKTRFIKGVDVWNKGLKGFGLWAKCSMKGKDNPAWKGGITSESMKIRNSKEYAEWRKKVFEKHSYTCQICGQVGGDLQVHHIKSFSLYPDLRFSVDNGLTLCVECHKNTDSYLNNKK